MSTETVVARMNPPHSEAFALAIEGACIEWGITSELDKAHFIGQVAHESSGFTELRESMNYAADRLVAVFGGHRITEAQAQRYGRTAHRKADQEAIANIVYGGAWGARNLGNTQPGDGWRFRGAGLIQLTGRDNFKRASRALFGDDTLLDYPEMLTQHVPAARAAAWYWRDKGIGMWAQIDEILAVSRAVNLGNAMHPSRPNGLEDRIKQTVKAKRLFAELRGGSTR